MLQIEYLASFDFRSDEYAHLFARSSATAFQHPLWLEGLYSRLAPCTGAEPIIITGRKREDRALVFVVPMLKRRYGPVPIVEFADLGVSDYCAPVIDSAFERLMLDDANIRRRLLEVFEKFPLCRLQKVREDSTFKAALFKAQNWEPLTFSAHDVRLYAPYAKWQSDNFAKKFRKDVKRCRNLLAEQGDVRFEEVCGSEAITSAFSALRAMREARWPEDQFVRPDFFEFYLDIAIRGQQEGFARTYATTNNGAVIAVDFFVSHRGRSALLVGGFDSDGFGRFSVGTLNVVDAISACIDKNDEVFDLAIGDEDYKKRYGTQPTAMWQLWLGNPAISNLASHAFRLRNKMRGVINSATA